VSLSQGQAKYQTGEPHLARQMILATFLAGQSETTPNAGRLACALLGGARAAMATARSRFRYGRSESGLAAWRARVLCRSALKHPYSLSRSLRSWAKGDGEETRPVVSPLPVTAYAGYLCLISFCDLRKEQRTFRLDRIIEMRSDSSATASGCARRSYDSQQTAARSKVRTTPTFVGFQPLIRYVR
jgi:hypothetical protein